MEYAPRLPPGLCIFKVRTLWGLKPLLARDLNVIDGTSRIGLFTLRFQRKHAEPKAHALPLLRPQQNTLGLHERNHSADPDDQGSNSRIPP